MPPKRHSILYFLLVCSSFAWVHGAEAVHNENNSFHLISKNAEPIDKDPLGDQYWVPLLKKMAKEEDPHIKGSYVKGFLVKHEKKYAELLQFLTQIKYLYSPQYFSLLCSLIKNIVETHPTLQKELLNTLVVIYKRIIPHIRLENDRQKQKKYFGIAFYHFVTLLSHKEYGKFFQNHKPYIEMLVHYFDNTMQYETFREPIAALPYKSRVISTAAKYIPFNYKKGKRNLFFALATQMKKLETSGDIVNLALLFQDCIYFKDIFTTEVRNSNAIEMAFIKEEFQKIFSPCKFWLTKPLGYSHILLGDAFLTFLKVCSNHSLMGMRVAQELFFITPLINIEKQQAAYQIIFENYCDTCENKKCMESKDFLYDVLKEVVLHQQAFLKIGGTREVLSSYQAALAFHFIWLYFPDLLRKQLLQEMLPPTIAVNKELQWLEDFWHQLTFALSFEGCLKEIDLHLEKNAFKRLETAITTSPPSEDYFNLLTSGFLQRSPLPKSIATNIYPLVKDYCVGDPFRGGDLSLLMVSRYLQYIEKCYAAYKRGSLEVKERACHAMVNFDVLGFSTYNPTDHDGHAIAVLVLETLGSYLILDSFSKNKKKSMLENFTKVLFAYNALEEIPIKPKSILQRYSFSVRTEEHPWIETIYKGWWQVVTSYKLHTPTLLMFGMEFFQNFAQVLSPSSAYQGIFRITLEMLLDLKHAEGDAYLFELPSHFFELLPVVHRQKTLHALLTRGLAICQKKTYAKKFRKKMLVTLAHYKLKVKAVATAFFTFFGKQKKEQRHLGYQFLGTWLDQQDSLSPFINALEEADKVKAFLEICQNWNYEIEQLPHATYFFAIQQQLLK